MPSTTFYKKSFATACIATLICCWLLAGRGLAAEPLRLKIEGLDEDAQANVEAALTLPPGLVKNGSVDQRWLERFVRQVPDKVRQALEAFGFYAAEVHTDLTTLKENEQLLTVTIKPGPPVRVERVQVTLEGPGAQRKSLVRLRDSFPLQAGGVLRQDRYEKAKKGLQDQAVAIGYLDAAYRLHEIRVDLVRNTADVLLALETGPRYYFGEVRLTGADNYPEPFLRRYLGFAKGDVYTQSRLGQTQLNYLDSDRFREIRLLPDRPAAVDEHIPVEIALEPSASKRLRPGVGYGTDTGARVSLKFENLNVFERGHELHLEMNVSEVRQILGAAYIWPDLKRLHSFTALRAGLEQEDVDAFKTRKVYTEIERARTLGRGKRGSVYTQVFYEDFDVADEKDGVFMIMPGVRFSHRGYRNLVRPRKGYQYKLELRGSDQWLGSDVGLLQLLAAGNFMVPLPWRFTIFVRGEGAGTLQDDTLQDIPVSLRFFAGGDQSVRGYAYKSLGPEDDEGEVIGGKHLLVGSIELERAIGENWGVAAFYDVGNAFNSLSDFEAAEGVGLGVRYYTPIGPVKFDIARDISEPDPGYRLHLSIGFGW